MIPKKINLFHIEQLLYLLFLLTAFLIPFRKSIPELSILIMLFAIVYLFLNRNVSLKTLHNFNHISVAAALFFSWLVLKSITLMSMPDIKNIFRYIGIFFIPLMVLLAATYFKGNQKVSHILYAFISANFIIAFCSIIMAAFTGIYWDIEFMALFPISWFPGVMALSIPPIIALIFYADNHRAVKTMLWIALLFIVACIYMASRRGIILSVATCVASIVVLEFWTNKNRLYRLTLAILLIGASLFALSNPRFEAIKAYQGYKYDIRLTMWTTALKMVAQTPSTLISGLGIEKGYEEYNRKLNRIDYYPKNMKEKPNSAHNDFLDILIMFGLIGLLLFVLIFIVNIYHSVQSRNVLLLSSVVMILIQFTFGSYFFWFRTGKYSLFFLLALFLIYRQPSEKHHISPAPKRVGGNNESG